MSYSLIVTHQHMTLWHSCMLQQSHHYLVASSEWNGQPILGQQHSGQRRRIVSGERHHLAIGIKRVALKKDDPQPTVPITPGRHWFAHCYSKLGAHAFRKKLWPTIDLFQHRTRRCPANACLIRPNGRWAPPDPKRWTPGSDKTQNATSCSGRKRNEWRIINK